MAKQVTYAKLHDGFFIPGLGNFKDTLPPDNRTLKEFRMDLEDNGSLTLSWIEQAGAQVYRKSCMVGAANVKSALYVPEKVTSNAGSESSST